MSQQPPPPPPPPYGYPQQPYYPPQDHPQATTVLILGILGLVVCQVISPIAWVMGTRVLREIDASGGRYGGRGNVNAGRICGIVGTVLIGISLGALLVFGVLFAVLGVAASSS